MSNPLISIIIPVYNNEERVLRCINSLISQSYKNLEIILINDGSTDKSEEKILSVKDERIKYFSQKNSGPSIARNKGLDVAKGDYITFIDSDDYILSDAYETIVSEINSTNADIVSFNIKKKLSENKTIVVKEPYSSEMTWQEFYKNFLLHNGLCSLCNKVFKSTLFHNIRLYEDIRLGEDSTALLRIIPSCKKIVHIAKPFYVYDLTNEGLSRNAKKNVYEYMTATRRVEEFYKQNNITPPLPNELLRLKICYYTLYFCPLKKAKKFGYTDYFLLAKDFHADFSKIVRCKEFKHIALKYRLFTLVYNLRYNFFSKQ